MFKSLIKVLYVSFEPKISTVESPVLFLLELKRFTNAGTKIHEEELEYENNGNGFYKFTLVEDRDRYFNQQSVQPIEQIPQGLLTPEFCTILRENCNEWFSRVYINTAP
jgi:hypothetical protein